MAAKPTSEIAQSLIAEQQQKHQFEQARMHDVQVLIDVLFRREEEIIKLIFDQLYDVGSVNLINQKVSSHQLKGIIKSIARFSKPVFRCVALYWVKKNCPELITNWLRRKVAFETYVPPAPTIVETIDHAKETVETVLPDSAEAVAAAGLSTAIATRSLPPSTVLTLNEQRAEIQTLRLQVRVFAGMALAAIAILGGTITYLSYRLEVTPIQLLSSPKTTALDRPAQSNCAPAVPPVPATNTVANPPSALAQP